MSNEYGLDVSLTPSSEELSESVQVASGLCKTKFSNPHGFMTRTLLFITLVLMIHSSN